MIAASSSVRPGLCPPHRSPGRTAPRRALRLALGVWFIVAGWTATLTAQAPDDRQPVDAKDRLAIRAAEAARIAAIEQIRPTVVSIFGSVRRGGGSGVLISPEGFALTNYHVVAACGEQGLAGLADGKLYPWKLIGLDPGGDLALIQLKNNPPDAPFPCAPLGSSRILQPGDWVMAVGNPFLLNENLKPTVTLGIVSGLHRYQGGTGPRKTLLVYGDCIQIDSSINPGNSGGPLFDMTGHVVGINGRGSFEERGRVNVGLGYAISVEQARRFLPELLATKVCQHGTLDATFASRDGRIVCEQLQRDAPIARLGLRPGDRLLRFDGRTIDYVNQLTNHLATLPAGWPVEVVFESGGARRTVHLRLGALDYGPMKSGRPNMPTPKPGDKPDRRKLIKVNKIRSTRPGKIRDPQVNRQQAERIIKQWRNSLAGAAALDKLKGFSQVLIYRPAGRPVQRIESVFTIRGRFRRRVIDLDGAKKRERQELWNGEQLIQRDGETEIRRPADQVATDPLVAYPAAVMALLRPDGLTYFKRLVLEGTDKAQGRVAARIAATDAHGNRFVFWFGLYDDAGRFRTRLLKHAMFPGGGAAPIIHTVGPPRPFGSIRYPLMLDRVAGIEETPRAHYDYKQFALLETIPDDLFSGSEFHLPASPSELPAAPPVAARAATPPPPNAFSAAIDFAQQRCVKIYGAGIGREKGFASGLIVSDDGLILTAQGVYLLGNTIRVATPDGRVYPATVVRTNDDIQVALLKIDASTPLYFDLPDQPNARSGDWVLAVANPFKVAGAEEPLSVNLGVVSMRAALDTRHRAQNFDVRGQVVLIDAITSNPGSAGGAVVGCDGRLVGMIGKLLASQSTNTRLNYAIPADLLRRFLDGLPVVESTSVPDTSNTAAAPGTLGIVLFTLPGRRAPAYIDRVLPGSPAAAAALRRDDLILAIDDQPIRNIGHYRQVEQTFRAGRPIRLTIKRGEKVLQVTVTPAAKESP